VSRWTILGLGILARLLSTLAGHYAGWLFRHIGSDDDEDFDFWSHLRAFGEWLLQLIPSWFLGHRVSSYAHDGDGWEPDLYR
jgi:hypothetical protein